MIDVQQESLQSISQGGPMRIDRSQAWWLVKAELEGDDEVGAGWNDVYDEFVRLANTEGILWHLVRKDEKYSIVESGYPCSGEIVAAGTFDAMDAAGRLFIGVHDAH